jgi:hypothetical protein
MVQFSNFFLLFSLIVAPLISVNAEPNVELLNKVISAQRKNFDSIDSIELKYRVDSSIYETIDGKLSVKKHLEDREYLWKNGCFRTVEKAKVRNSTHIITNSTTYNGESYQFLTEPDSIMFIWKGMPDPKGRTSTLSEMPLLLPYLFLGKDFDPMKYVKSADTWQKLLRQLSRSYTKWNIVSNSDSGIVTFNRKVTFQDKSEADTVVEFDSKIDFLPISFKNRSFSTDLLVTAHEWTKVSKSEWLPLTVKMKTYHKDVLSYEVVYTIDPKSISINKPILGDAFLLSASSAKIITDGNTGARLK